MEGTFAAQNILFDSVWVNFLGFSLMLSTIIAISIVYCMVRTRQIRKMEKQYYTEQTPSVYAQKTFGLPGRTATGTLHQERWRDVVDHGASESVNDWKYAILEADVMLDDALTQRGYTGEGLGEKMKQVQRSDMHSIDDAWEAHKLRNRIAHEGSNLELTQREARRIIGLYERALRELSYIS